MKKYVILLLTAVLLTACDKPDDKPDDITRVKSLVYEKLDNVHTAGDILSNREACQNVTWKSYTDENNQRIVEYVCDLKLDKPHAYLSKVLNKQIEEYKNFKRVKGSEEDLLINLMMEALQGGLTIKWYRQKILWSVPADSPPVMQNCSLTIRPDSGDTASGSIEVFDVISSELISDRCFEVAYQSEYVDEFYNMELYHYTETLEDYVY